MMFRVVFSDSFLFCVWKMLSMKLLRFFLSYLQRHRGVNRDCRASWHLCHLSGIWPPSCCWKTCWQSFSELHKQQHSPWSLPSSHNSPEILNNKIVLFEVIEGQWRAWEKRENADEFPLVEANQVFMNLVITITQDVRYIPDWQSCLGTDANESSAENDPKKR